MRIGTRTYHKKRWTPQGVRPKCPMKIGYEFAYLYTGIVPQTGDLFCLILPRMTKVCFEIFVKEYLQHLQGNPTLMVLDSAANHQKDVVDNTMLKLLHLPKAAPELNPVERFFKELRKMLSNQVFEDINQLIEQVQMHLQH
jgi:transposase